MLEIQSQENTSQCENSKCDSKMAAISADANNSTAKMIFSFANGFFIYLKYTQLTLTKS